MIAEAPSGARCGIDTIELARVEQLLQDKSPDELNGLFTEQELLDAGTSAGRVTTLAGCFAAKEACCKLFPRELALERITPADRVRRRE